MSWQKRDRSSKRETDWLTDWRLTDKRDSLAGGELLGHLLSVRDRLGWSPDSLHLYQQYWLETALGNFACRQRWNDRNKCSNIDKLMHPYFYVEYSLANRMNLRFLKYPTCYETGCSFLLHIVKEVFSFVCWILYRYKIAPNWNMQE